MKFLCVGYYDPAKMQALPAKEVEAVMQECPPHMDVLRDTGQLVFVAGAGAGARYLRRVAGKLAASEPKTGPAAKVGCVFVLEAANQEEAMRLASLHPTTQVAAGEDLGWYLEVLPVQDFYAQGL